MRASTNMIVPTKYDRECSCLRQEQTNCRMSQLVLCGTEHYHNTIIFKPVSDQNVQQRVIKEMNQQTLWSWETRLYCPVSWSQLELLENRKKGGLFFNFEWNFETLQSMDSSKFIQDRLHIYLIQILQSSLFSSLNQEIIKDLFFVGIFCLYLLFYMVEDERYLTFICD